MSVHAMNHFTILAEDLDQTCAFYRDLLGLEVGYRPNMGFPGAWLYAGEQAVLHVIAGRALPHPRRGVIDHMAYSATNLKQVTTKLKARGVTYDLGRQTETNAWQLFFQDPNGAVVELDFDPSEQA